MKTYIIDTGREMALQILSISLIKDISFRKNFFDMALLFINSMLKNNILCSVEPMYGLTNAHIEKLESVDKYLLQKIFNASR